MRKTKKAARQLQGKSLKLTGGLVFLLFSFDGVLGGSSHLSAGNSQAASPNLEISKSLTFF